MAPRACNFLFIYLTLAFQQMLSCDHLKWLEGTLHLHTTTCHNCLHFCVILLFPLQIFKLRITLNCQGCLLLVSKWNYKKKGKKKVSKTWSLVVHHFPIFPTNMRPKCYPFHRDAYFPALLKRSSISNNVFLLFGCGLSLPFVLVIVLSMHGHILWFIIFGFWFSTLTSENPM